MSKYTAVISWQRATDEPFTDNKYSRGHSWTFDGGLSVPASSAPQVVPVPHSIEANVDPEEAFVASLSSCHMLWFLYLAADQGYVVDSYYDDAEGIMGKNSERKLAMLTVTLRPKIAFGNATPVSPETLAELHHQAHEKCFIANSVKTEVAVEPIL